ALLDQHAAGVRLLLADDHPEDGRLAGAVRANEADLLAAEDGHRRIEKEDAAAMLLADRFETDHQATRGGGSSAGVDTVRRGPLDNPDGPPAEPTASEVPRRAAHVAQGQHRAAVA